MKKTAVQNKEDLAKASETYHFIGIGGIGMSGLARILLAQGKKVTGSDLSSNYVTQGLEQSGAKVFFGHDKNHVADGATVVFSTDIPNDNPELAVAKLKNLRLMHRSDLLHALATEKEIVAVAGTHGKTTSTSLLIHVLKSANFDPSFAVGGVMNNYATNAGEGAGAHFVLEADESDGTFLKYDYSAAIVTNIDTDHIAHFGSFEKVIESFDAFIKKSTNKRLLWVCADDVRLKQYSTTAMTYGFSPDADAIISDFSQHGFEISFTITFEGKVYKDIRVPLTGIHNARNAASVFLMALSLQVKPEAIYSAFSTFCGAKRRMDKKGDIQSVQLYDDYAHHPTEIKTTLHALRLAVCEKRIIAIFQPHRYSRMRYVLDELPGAFSEADCVIVTDLYTAQEKPVEGVSTEKIVSLIKSSHPNVQYIPRSELAAKVREQLMPHDVVITLGAGDITKVGGEIKDSIEKQGIKKLQVLVLLGGKSCEHEVSCTSSKTALTHLNRGLYAVSAIRIGLDGAMQKMNGDGTCVENKTGELLSKEVLDEFMRADVVMPILHGPYGEDGTIQGFLEILNKPYTGCDTRASAISMDKIVCKQIAEQVGVPTTPFVACDYDEWIKRSDAILQEVRSRLTLPYFVKPSHLGSSVGVTKVTNEKELRNACERAFAYDTHVLIEQGIAMREIEYALLGNHAIHIPAPAEVKTGGQFYSYEAKYATTGFPVDVVAPLSEEDIERGRRLAEKMYRKVGCTGLARIDMFLDAQGVFYFNEINPIPGMTPNSAYPKIMGRSIGLEKLFDQLIILAFERSRRAERVFGYSCKNLSRS